MQQSEKFTQVLWKNVQRIGLHRPHPLVPTALVLTRKNRIAKVTADIETGVALAKFLFRLAIQGGHLPTWMADIDVGAARTCPNVRFEVQLPKSSQSGFTVEIQNHDSGDPASHHGPRWRTFSPPTSELLPGRQSLLKWPPA